MADLERSGEWFRLLRAKIIYKKLEEAWVWHCVLNIAASGDDLDIDALIAEAEAVLEEADDNRFVAISLPSQMDTTHAMMAGTGN